MNRYMVTFTTDNDGTAREAFGLLESLGDADAAANLGDFTVSRFDTLDSSDSLD